VIDLPPVTRVRTPRTARVAHLGPERAERSIWVVLHGYRQLAPWFLRHFRSLDDGSRRILAPEALNRFYVGDPDGRHGPDARIGATWMTREDRDQEIDDYVEYLERVLGEATGEHDELSVVVLGFSQGAHTAARWMLRSEHPARAVVLWGEGLPHDTTAEELKARPRRWVLIRGDADRSRDPAREARDAERFLTAGLDPEVRVHAAGHRLHTPTLEELAADLGV